VTIGIIDAVEWQSTVDMATGRVVQAESPLISLARGIQRDFRYPGDQNSASSEWVTDVGLALSSRYRPDFIFLNYANPSFFGIFGGDGGVSASESIGFAFDAVSRFVEESGYTPVILGSGGMLPLKERINISGLDGLENITGPVPSCATVTAPSEGDLDLLGSDPRIRTIMRAEEYIERFSPCAEQIPRIPNLILGAEEGYIFRGFGGMSRPIHSIPASESEIPVHSEIGPVSAITDIKSLILEHLSEDEKIALIMVEGVGTENFPLPYTPCANTDKGFAYQQGAGQYLALLTGDSIGRQPFPPACDHYREDGEESAYPFSGYFTSLPENSLGREYAGRSAAVGSRSIFTHATPGTDITVECCARNLYNFGTLSTIQERR